MQYTSHKPCVYILASRRDGTIYIGVTAQLFARVMMHKEGEVDGFTKRYDVNRLVYYEFHQSLSEAHRREKQLKKWNRAWKVRLIEQINPEWIDLLDASQGILASGPSGQSSR